MRHSLNILKAAPVIIAITVLSGCTPNAKPTMTPMQVRSLQTHTFETSKDIAFNAVLTVLQNLGYIVKSADRDTGFITAESPSTNKTGFWQAMTNVTSTGRTMVTAFAQEIHPGTSQVRLNFVNSRHSSGAYGQSNTIDHKILDPKVYQNAFNKIGTAIFVRASVQ